MGGRCILVPRNDGAGTLYENMLKLLLLGGTGYLYPHITLLYLRNGKNGNKMLHAAYFAHLNIPNYGPAILIGGLPSRIAWGGNGVIISICANTTANVQLVCKTTAKRQPSNTISQGRLLIPEVHTSWLAGMVIFPFLCGVRVYSVIIYE